MNNASQHIEFKIADYGSRDWELAVELREDVLRKPLGTVFSQDELDAEENHVHIIGLYNSELVATAVLVPEGKALKMQRVAVKEMLRNVGIGSSMILFCETVASSESYNMLYCHARDTAVDFYVKNGYVMEGDYFDEDGIPHVKMFKHLSQ
jgi:predicted GNAT family N-acyltransferase